jgi:tape measure domain-containing protein
VRAATFTTYINTREEPGAYAALDKMASVAVARYGTITRAADEAARATTGVLGGSGTVGRGNAMARELNSLASAERAVAQQAGAAGRASSSAGTAMRTQGRDAQIAAGHNMTLARSLQTTATSLNIVQGPLGPLAGRVSALSRALTELTGFRLGLAGLGAGLFAIGRSGNAYAILQSRLQPFFQTQEETNRAMERVIDIAKRTRAPLESIAEIYSRLTAVADDYGLSQERVARLVQFASKAATLSGGTAETRRAGLNQFAQAVGKGRLNDDELKSVMENLPVLAQQIAKGFQNADGSIGTALGSLRDLGAQGQLTMQAILAATERTTADLDEKFARLPLTLSQSGTEFTNALTTMIGKFDQAIGFTSTLAQGISTIANNLRAVTALVFGFAAAWAAPKIIAGAGAIATSITGIFDRLVTIPATIKAMDAAWVQDLQAAHAHSMGVMRDLELERAAIVKNIEALEAKAAAARAASTVPPGGHVFAGTTKAARELENAQRALIGRQGELRENTKLLMGAQVQAQQQGEKLGEATKNVAGRMGSLKSAAMGVVNFLGGPWGIAIGLATVALFLFSTQGDKTKDAMDRLGVQLGTLATQLDQTKQKADDAADALGRVRAAQKQDALDQNLTDLTEIRKSAGAQLRSMIVTQSSSPFGMGIQGPGQYSSPGQKEARQLIERFEKGTQRAAGVAREWEKLSRRFPGLIKPDELGAAIRKGGPLDTVAGAEQAFNKSNAEILGMVLPTSGAPARKPKTKAQLSAEAQALVAQTDLQRAKAELAAVRAEPRPKTEADEKSYVDRLAQATKKVTELTKAEKDARAAAAAGRTAAAKAERDQRQDSLDAAAKRRDKALLGLMEGGLSPDSDEFIQKRQVILKTYDDEVNAIDASKAASHSALTQMIDDAEKLAKAAKGNTERRSDIVGQWSDQPKAVSRANDQIDDLEKMVDGFIVQNDKLIRYTQTMFDADVRTIQEGLRRPLNDLLRDHERELEISRLILQGRAAEADALRTAYGLYDSMGELQQSDYESIVRNAEEHERINDLLRQRERITATITGLVDSARDGFEQLLMDLPEKGSKAVGTFFKSMVQNVWRMTARSLTERLFAGADEKVRSLISGRNSVDQAVYQFNGSLGKVSTATATAGTSISLFDTSVGKAKTATERLASAAEECAKRLNGVMTGTDADVGATAINAAAGVANTGAIGAATASVGKALSAIMKASTAANDNEEIVVSGTQAKKPVPVVLAPMPNGRGAAGTIFGQFFSNLDKLTDKLRGRTETAGGVVDSAGNPVTGAKFFSGIGEAVGTAFEGAGTGAMASGIARAFGLKQSNTGAMIGGAAGQMGFAALGLPPELGGMIGGLIGGTIGGLFKKVKYGTAGVSLNQWGEVVGGEGGGRGAGEIAAAKGSAGGVSTGINQIMNVLGATISSLPGITIGNWEGRARVALTETNKPLHSKNFGPDVLKDFGEGGEEEAIAYAIRYAIEKGVITGISQASINIIKSGQDLQQALEKAVAIESIPKRLMQRTDPVRYAVTTLNDEFSRT